MIGVNPIVAKNDTIVTLHLDNEERDSERLAPYGELYGDDTLALHRVTPATPLSVRLVFTSSLSSLPSFLKIEYVIRLMEAPSSTSIMEIGSRRCDPERTTASIASSTLQAS
jgi:hypothetical protein